MKEADFLKLPISLPYKGNVGTFLEISTNDKGEECVIADGYCADLSAIKFDDVKVNWYGLTLPNQVRSCDALFVDEDNFYLIEFKTGKPENIDIHRKIYDSVIALMEHGVLTLSDCRDHLQYIVVSRHYKDTVSGSLLGYLEDGMLEPWEYRVDRQTLETWDKHEIRKLTNFLFSKVYKLSLLEFERFAKNRNWSN